MDPRPYHHGDLREALVTAGVRAAEARGREALTLRELAKAVGVSPTAAYRHFPSLDHVVAAVSQRARERLAREMIAARDAVTPRRGAPAAELAWLRFGAIGRAYVRFGVAEPRLFETAFTPCTARPGRPDEPAAWEVLVDSLDELVAVGEVSPDRRPEAPLIAWAAVHGLATIIAGGGLPPGVDPDEAVEPVLDGVRRAIGS